jgi:hypothetical protein
MVGGKTVKGNEIGSRERERNTYISQHMVQTTWLLALPVRAIGAGVLCFFFLEMQEDVVV